MKIAYIQSERPTVYQNEFFAAMKSRWDVTKYGNYDQIKEPNDYDVLYVEYAGMEAVKASKNEHRNLMVRMHGMEVYEGKLQLINWPNVRWLLGLHDHQLEYFKTRWYNCHPQKTGVSNIQVLDDYFSLKRNGENNNVGMINNITGRKGLDSIPDFLLRYPDKHIHLIGKTCKYGNPVWEYVWWRLRNERTINRFHYQKFLNHELVNNWLENMSYLWLSSIQEGQPRVLLEAMAKGVTPIIHNHAGASQLWPSEFIYADWKKVDGILEHPWNKEKIRDWVISRYGKDKILDQLEVYLTS